jgi:hypothetical protein
MGEPGGSVKREVGSDKFSLKIAVAKQVLSPSLRES